MIPRSFQAQLTLLFGALALVVVAALSYPLGRLLADRAVQERGGALSGLASGVALQLSEGLQERMREVELLAVSSEAHGLGLNPDAWARELAWLRQGRPHYAWIGVADSRGMVIAAHGDVLKGKDVSQRPWFQQGLQHPFLGDVHSAKLLSELLPPAANGEPLRFIDFAAPLRNSRQEVIGVLGVHADWQWTRDVISRVSLQHPQLTDARVFVLDARQQVIHHPDGASAGTAMTRAPVSRSSAVQAYTDGGGLRYVASSATVPSTADTPALGWTIVAMQPESLVLRDVSHVRRKVLLYGAVAGALAMLLAWLFADRFSRPLQRISQAAEQIRAGHRDVAIAIETDSPTELNQLSEVLSGMTASLVARENELKETNALLEARVWQRTAELQAANQHLATLAHQDALTGLLNRRAADNALASQLALHRRKLRSIGLLMCDLDHFKRINDQHGHAVGDAVLQTMADCLLGNLRESDVAARFGGEEFLVILPETDAAGVMRVADKVRQAVAALNIPDVGRCTISVGAACVDDGDSTPAAFVQAADEALYRAKRDGRNRVCMAPSITEPEPSTVTQS